ncbi:MAG: V-type ATPase subunit [bacterium]
MIRTMESNLDYLAARLHGRRSRLAEGSRLDSLSRLKTISRLAQVILPGATVKTVPDAQRLMVAGLIDEMDDLLPQLTGARARLMAWMLTQFQMTNLKIMIRGIHSRTPPEILARHLITLPRHLSMNNEALAKAPSLEALIPLLPEDLPGRMMRDALVASGKPREPFFIETRLDQHFFQEELSRVDKLPPHERDPVAALVTQEIDLFHLMLVLRGRFHYDLAPKALAGLHVAGTRLTQPLFEAMLSAPTRLAAATLTVGLALEALPASVNAPAIEALAWARYLKIANRMFRQSFTEFGLIAGYMALRRMEVANLITLSEGIRAQLGDETIRLHIIPPSHPEALYV